MRSTTWVLALGLTLSGCSKDGGLSNLPGIERFLPKVSFKRLAVNDIDFQGVSTDFVFEVQNPNPLRVGMSSFTWQLDLAGQRFLSGSNPDGIQLESRGTSRVKIPVTVVFKDLIAGIADTAGKDEVPFAFSGKMGFDTPLGEVGLPYRAKGQFPVLKVPKVAFKGIRLDNLNVRNQSATLAIDLGVAHEQASAMSFTGFDYTLKLAGKNVVSGLVETLGDVAPGKEKTISLPITINLLQVGQTIATAITTGGKIDAGLDARLTVGTPFGPVPLAIDEKGNFRIER